MTDFTGRRVLITGGASGIGRLLGTAASNLGSEVVLWDLDGEALSEAVARLERRAALPVHGYLCDVADRHQVYDVAGRVKEEVGSIDILVNNAGIVSGDYLLNNPDGKIVATFGVNTLALFWVTKAFLPEMLERGEGHVVTIASAAGLVGVARQTDYAASKWAAVGFNESLRAELAQLAPRVRTTVVCPYYVDTGMFHGVETKVPWLLPILKERDVARSIVQAILKDRPEVFLPPPVASLPALRLLPTRLFDAVMDLLGINDTMRTFEGRRPAEPGSPSP